MSNQRPLLIALREQIQKGLTKAWTFVTKFLNPNHHINNFENAFSFITVFSKFIKNKIHNKFNVIWEISDWKLYTISSMSLNVHTNCNFLTKNRFFISQNPYFTPSDRATFTSWVISANLITCYKARILNLSLVVLNCTRGRTWRIFRMSPFKRQLRKTFKHTQTIFAGFYRRIVWVFEHFVGLALEGVKKTS